MTSPSQSPESRIRQYANEIGFNGCGFARCEKLEEWRNFFTGFIARDGHAGFSYLKNNLEKRLNPNLILPGAKSVIALLLNYFPPDPEPENEAFIISKYARGSDYHPVMKSKMKTLVDELLTLNPESENRIFADSGVLSEKVWGQRCGLGWQGKNTLLINKLQGSFHFIGLILTTIELEPDRPETDHCGSCTRCIDACPTGALATPWQLDIRRCISYYTIENKEDVPEELVAKFNNRIFGCDICQDVCPWNRNAQPTGEPAFSLTPPWLSRTKAQWLELTPQMFDQFFRGTTIERTGYEYFMKMIRMNYDPSGFH
jgi:epoxyqueuosine reductase